MMQLSESILEVQGKTQTLVWHMRKILARLSLPHTTYLTNSCDNVATVYDGKPKISHL